MLDWLQNGARFEGLFNCNNGNNITDVVEIQNHCTEEAVERDTYYTDVTCGCNNHCLLRTRHI